MKINVSYSCNCQNLLVAHTSLSWKINLVPVSQPQRMQCLNSISNHDLIEAIRMNEIKCLVPRIITVWCKKCDNVFNWPGSSYPKPHWDQCWVGQTGWGPQSLLGCQHCCLAVKTSSTERKQVDSWEKHVEKKALKTFDKCSYQFHHKRAGLYKGNAAAKITISLRDQNRED